MRRTTLALVWVAVVVLGLGAWWWFARVSPGAAGSTPAAARPLETGLAAARLQQAGAPAAAVTALNRITQGVRDLFSQGLRY